MDSLSKKPNYNIIKEANYRCERTKPKKERILRIEPKTERILNNIT